MVSRSSFLQILQEVGEVSGAVWIEEVVSDCANVAWKSWKAMQRKMAQPFET